MGTLRNAVFRFIPFNIPQKVLENEKACATEHGQVVHYVNSVITAVPVQQVVSSGAGLKGLCGRMGLLFRRE